MVQHIAATEYSSRALTWHTNGSWCNVQVVFGVVQCLAELAQSGVNVEADLYLVGVAAWSADGMPGIQLSAQLIA
jgi:hypothetical protein